jgi:two-component system, NarL family, response regulator NreC
MSTPIAGIRILVVDDHVAIRRGLRHLLAACADIEVVGEAADGESALSAAQRLIPDVVLLDVHLLNSSGYEVAARIRMAMPLVRIIMLASFDETDQAGQAIASGAQGYLLKRDADACLAGAIRALACGGTVSRNLPLHQSHEL